MSEYNNYYLNQVSNESTKICEQYQKSTETITIIQEMINNLSLAFQGTSGEDIDQIQEELKQYYDTLETLKTNIDNKRKSIIKEANELDLIYNTYYKFVIDKVGARDITVTDLTTLPKTIKWLDDVTINKNGIIQIKIACLTAKLKGDMQMANLMITSDEYTHENLINHGFTFEKKITYEPWTTIDEMKSYETDTFSFHS